MKARWARIIQRRALSVSWRQRRSSSRFGPPPTVLIARRGNAWWAIQPPPIELLEELKDVTAVPTSLAERRLLGKARLSGISSLEQLRIEADVGHARNIGTRMTDTPQYRQDLDLWLLLLEFRKHRDGIKGVKAIWRGMKFRGSPVTLERRNRNAQDLLSFIIKASREDIPFLIEFCKDCVNQNVFRDRLFVWVVGALLLSQPKSAPTFSLLLRHTCFQGKSDLLEVFRVACDSPAEDAFQRFCEVRNFLPDFQVYTEIITILWELNRSPEAFMMHKYLIARGDLPRTFEILLPFIQHLAASDEGVEEFLRDLAGADVSFEAQSRRAYARARSRIIGFSPESLNIVASHTFGHEPRKLSDEIIARALVTFSFDFGIQSMRFFGLIEVGPQAVRQIVRSSPDSETLKQRFEKLKEYEIDTGSSAYVLTLKRLALNKVFKMAQELARSDMHHDEFEDQDLQRRLLGQHLANMDHAQMNATMTVLNRGRLDLTARTYSINVLLRNAILAQDWPGVLDLVGQITQQGYEIKISMLDLLAQSLLHSKSSPQARYAESIDRIGFVLGVLQRLLAAGTPIQPAAWRQPLISLGFQSRLNELENVSMWLADWYTGAFQQGRRYGTDLQKLFTAGFQEALIAWDFTKRDWKAEWTMASPINNAYPWLRGAILLKRLRDQNGLVISVPALQKIFVFRLMHLAQARGLHRVLANREHASSHLVGPKRCLETWCQLWGVQLSDEEEQCIMSQISRAASSRNLQRSSKSRS